jgi:hypothetical protein
MLTNVFYPRLHSENGCQVNVFDWVPDIGFYHRRYWCPVSGERRDRKYESYDGFWSVHRKYYNVSLSRFYLNESFTFILPDIC